MPDCNNCGTFVSRQYVRVFAPPSMDTVRVCPSCEDILRDGADIREAHSPRHPNDG
jgi:NAD-dependent SIR2 family protein deacetylase